MRPAYESTYVSVLFEVCGHRICAVFKFRRKKFFCQIKKRPGAGNTAAERFDKGGG